MSVLATDDFNRADASPIGGNWTIRSADGLAIVSNAVSGSDDASYYNAVGDTADSYVKWKFTTIADGDGGPLIRCSATAYTAYHLNCWTGNGGIDIYEITAGGYSLIASSSMTLATNDVIEARAAGSTITGWQNGTQRISVTDSTITTGRGGAFIYNGAVRLDDYEYGDFVSGGSGFPFHRNPMAHMLIR